MAKRPDRGDGAARPEASEGSPLRVGASDIAV